MAEIRPFRALRFTEKAGALQELTCPPYDIISESQRLAYLKRNPQMCIRDRYMCSMRSAWVRCVPFPKSLPRRW